MVIPFWRLKLSDSIHGAGLDPYYGFYHKTDTSIQALVYDLIAPFRWLVEFAAYKLAVDESKHGRSIRNKDYAHTKTGAVMLDSNIINRFLGILERKFQSERGYVFKHGLKRSDGTSMCQEITIAKIQVIKLAEYCLAPCSID
jgi:CRISP-associated protein Cas1